MTTNDILNLDCREEENEKIIQKALFKIPVIEKKCAKDKKVPLEIIEKVICSICKKYEIAIQYINPDFLSGKDTIYCISLKTTDEHAWLGNVYGKSIYEALAKCAIKMYSEVKKGINERK